MDEEHRNLADALRLLSEATGCDHGEGGGCCLAIVRQLLAKREREKADARDSISDDELSARTLRRQIEEEQRRERNSE